MDFIHIADIHLGAVPEEGNGWSIDRGREIYDTLFHVVKVCEEKKVDLLLIAGDLFHRQPLLRELKELNYVLGRLTHTKVVIIAGNHDYIAMHSNYTDFKWNENTFFIENADMDSIYLEELNTEVYGFSYHTRDIYEGRYDNAFCTVEERINILIAHGGDERNIPMNYKKMEEAGFDYIALGHIHKPTIYSDKMAYSGSLEPLDRTELNEHGYIYGVITKQEDGTSDTKIEFVPYSKRQYKKIIIEVSAESTNRMIQETLEQEIDAAGKDNLYLVKLQGRRDPEIIIDRTLLYSLGNIVDIEDQVLPDYDFERLSEENKDNLIGAYITKIKSSSEDEELTQKALYYGIEALLNAKER